LNQRRNKRVNLQIKKLI